MIERKNIYSDDWVKKYSDSSTQISYEDLFKLSLDIHKATCARMQLNWFEQEASKLERNDGTKVDIYPYPPYNKSPYMLKIFVDTPPDQHEFFIIEKGVTQIGNNEYQISWGCRGYNSKAIGYYDLYLTSYNLDDIQIDDYHKDTYRRRLFEFLWETSQQASTNSPDKYAPS